MWKLFVDYTNHRGNRAWREISGMSAPIVTVYPPYEVKGDHIVRSMQSCVSVLMVDRNAKRTLALRSIHGFHYGLEKPSRTWRRPEPDHATDVLSYFIQGRHIVCTSERCDRRIFEVGIAAGSTNKAPPSLADALQEMGKTKSHLTARHERIYNAGIQWGRTEIPFLSAEETFQAARNPNDAAKARVEAFRAAMNTSMNSTPDHEWRQAMENRIDTMVTQVTKAIDNIDEIIVAHLVRMNKLEEQVGYAVEPAPESSEPEPDEPELNPAPMQSTQQAAQPEYAPVDLRVLQNVNTQRQKEWDPNHRISGDLGLLYRANELAGEVGETCNKVKKLVRERLGIAGSRATLAEIGIELGDGIICHALLAEELGLDLSYYVRKAFNGKSAEIGLKTRL